MQLDPSTLNRFHCDEKEIITFSMAWKPSLVSCPRGETTASVRGRVPARESHRWMSWARFFKILSQRTSLRSLVWGGRKMKGLSHMLVQSKATLRQLLQTNVNNIGQARGDIGSVSSWVEANGAGSLTQRSNMLWRMSMGTLWIGFRSAVCCSMERIFCFRLFDRAAICCSTSVNPTSVGFN